MTRSYELLNYIWLEGFKPYYFDGEGRALRYPTMEQAVAELQDDFDMVAREIEDGERDPDFGLSPDEFEIRCIETGERFSVELANGKVRCVKN